MVKFGVILKYNRKIEKQLLFLNSIVEKSDSECLFLYLFYDKKSSVATQFSHNFNNEWLIKNNLTRLNNLSVRSFEIRENFVLDNSKYTELEETAIVIDFNSTLDYTIISQDLSKLRLWKINPQIDFHNLGNAEIINREKVLSCSIVEHSLTSNKSAVLWTGDFKVAPNLWKVRRIVYTEIQRTIIKFFNNTDSLKTTSFQENIFVDKQKVHSQKSAIALVFFFNWFSLFICDYYNKIFKIDVWNIGIVNHPIEEFVLKDKYDDITWFPLDRKKELIADPFVYPDHTGTNIVAETLNFKEGKGKIEVISFPEFKRKELFDFKWHLSFPFSIETEDKDYIMPEASQSNAIRLYSKSKEENTWKENVIIDNFPGVDSVAFFHDGNWWLFTSRARYDIHYNLYFFHATDLMGEWTPHPMNPVKTDIRSARCAGPIITIDDQFYRPGMDYSHKIEGRIVVNRITTLTKTHYAEEYFKTVDPMKDKTYGAKIHTLTKFGDKTIIDGCYQGNILSSWDYFKFKLHQLRIFK